VVVGADDGSVEKVQVAHLGGTEATGYLLTLTRSPSAGASAKAPIVGTCPEDEVTVKYPNRRRGASPAPSGPSPVTVYGVTAEWPPVATSSTPTTATTYNAS
jgi:hypothetical protein